MNLDLLIPKHLKDMFTNGAPFAISATGKAREIADTNMPILPLVKVVANHNCRTGGRTHTYNDAGYIKLLQNLVNLNPQDALSDISYAFKIGCILVATTSGLVKSDALVKYQLDANAVNTLNNAIVLENISPAHAALFMMIENLMPTCVNIISCSVINFINKGHHFPSTAMNLNKKMFLPYQGVEIEELIDETGKLTQIFFEAIYPAAKMVHEVFWYYHVILENKQAAPQKNFQLLNSPIYIIYVASDALIKIRSKPTVNCFTGVSILALALDKLAQMNLAVLCVTPRMYGQIILLDKILRSDPFHFHPSRQYFDLIHPDFDRAARLRDEIYATLGGLLHEFCQGATGSLKKVKCSSKFEGDVKPIHSALVAFYYEMTLTSAGLSAEVKAIIKKKNQIVNTVFTTQEEYDTILEEFNTGYRLVVLENLY